MIQAHANTYESSASPTVGTSGVLSALTSLSDDEDDDEDDDESDGIISPRASCNSRRDTATSTWTCLSNSVRMSSGKISLRSPPTCLTTGSWTKRHILFRPGGPRPGAMSGRDGWYIGRGRPAFCSQSASRRSPGSSRDRPATVGRPSPAAMATCMGWTHGRWASQAGGQPDLLGPGLTGLPAGPAPIKQHLTNFKFGEWVGYENTMRSKTKKSPARFANAWRSPMLVNATGTHLHHSILIVRWCAKDPWPCRIPMKNTK